MEFLSMNRGIKVALWGFGHMNKIILSMLLEKGYEVVSVIGNHNHGQDAGVIAQISQGKLGVLITPRDQVIQELQKTRPQVVILATKSYLFDIQAELTQCAELGINVITIAQEAFYSWNTQPQLTGELDSLFRKNNAVYTGSGFQDVYWGQLPALLVTTAHKVNKIKIITSYNVDDYGQALCEAHGVGLIQEEFNKKFDNARPTYVFMSNQWIARKLNKKILETKQQIIPIILEKDVQSKSYGLLKAGQALGLKSVVTTITEDVIIETQMMGYVFYDDHTDVLKVKLQGQPEIQVDVKQPTAITTCCSAIHRIPQVVNSIKKGYVPTYEL